MFGGTFGMQEIALIAVLVLLLFGAKQIPQYMRGIGEGIRELRKGAAEITEGIEEAVAEEAPDG